MTYDFICPCCGKKLFSFEKRMVIYESPLKTCKKCGTAYLDPRCHEMAAEGIPDDSFKISPSVVAMVIGALILWRGVHLAGMKQLGMPEEMQWFLPTAFILFGAGVILWGLSDIIMIKTGKKADKLKKKYDESLERLSNISYARTLAQMGYPVPERFL